MNKTLFFGNVINDPAVRYDESGKKEVTFSLVTSEFIIKDGERVPEIITHTIVAKDRYAESIEKRIQKGAFLIIEGKITYPIQKDVHGTKRTVTEIVCKNFRLTGNKKVFEPSLASL